MKHKKGKKLKVVGVRMDDDLYAVLENLADNEERRIASMARILLVESLRARGLVSKNQSGQ